MPQALQRDCGFASSSPPQPSRLPFSSTSSTYSDSGIRVKQVTTKNSATVTTEFVVDHNNPTGYAQTIEQKVEGDIVRSYTIGLDEITQAVTDNPGPAAVISQFLHDGKGSVRQLADAAAELIAAATKDMVDVLKLDYDAYGNAVNYAAETVATALLYNGEFVDAVTGQQYLRARWYDQATGRFNRVDPIPELDGVSQTHHRYVYASLDPVHFGDPSGNISAVLAPAFPAASGIISQIGAVLAAITLGHVLIIAAIVLAVTAFAIGIAHVAPAPPPRLFSMRVQVQENAALPGGSGSTVSIPLASTASITVAEARGALAGVYILAMNASWFSAARYGASLRSAIITMSKRLGRYPGVGGVTVIRNFERVDFPTATQFYRLDFENLHGTNLRR